MIEPTDYQATRWPHAGIPRPTVLAVIGRRIALVHPAGVPTVWCATTTVEGGHHCALTLRYCADAPPPERWGIALWGARGVRALRAPQPMIAICRMVMRGHASWRPHLALADAAAIVRACHRMAGTSDTVRPRLRLVGGSEAR